MNTKDIILSVIATAMSVIMTSGCVEEIENPSYNRDGQVFSVNLDIQTDKPSTRSLIGDDAVLDEYENKISNITIFQVEECVPNKPIVASTYYYSIANGERPRIEGIQGRNYTLYCLVNFGDMRSKINTSNSLQDILDLNIIELPGDKTEEKLQYGLKRSAIVSLNQGLKNNEVLTIHPTPIYARVDVRIVKNFKNGNFKIQRINILNDNWVQYPFVVENPQMLYDDKIKRFFTSDISTTDDIAKLERGETVRYYVSEYVVGKLIDNPTKDPWKKVPNDAINKTKPSYIEINGDFTDKTGLFTASANYRMYLGENAYDNFDIKAGYQYTLTITLTDDSGFNNASWKIETSNVKDSRFFYFLESNYNFIDFYSDNYVIPVNTNINKEQMLYQLYTATTKPKPLTPEEMGLVFNGENLSVVQDTRLLDCEVARFATLYATSWDGRIVDSTRIIASEAYKAPYVSVDYCSFPPEGGRRRELSIQIGYKNLRVDENEEVVAEPFSNYEIKNAIFFSGSSTIDAIILSEGNGKYKISVPSDIYVDNPDNTYFQFMLSYTPIGFSKPFNYWYRVYYYTNKVSCQNEAYIDYDNGTKTYRLINQSQYSEDHCWYILSDERFIKFTNITNPRLGNRVRNRDEFKATLGPMASMKPYSRVFAYDNKGGFIANFENSVNKKLDKGGERYFLGKEFGITLSKCEFRNELTDFTDSLGMAYFNNGFLLEFYPYKGLPCQYIETPFGPKSISQLNVKFIAKNDYGFSDEKKWDRLNGDNRFFKFDINKPAIFFSQPAYWPNNNYQQKISYYKWEVVIDIYGEEYKLIVENDHDKIDWSLTKV